jgi:hypothetical protein
MGFQKFGTGDDQKVQVDRKDDQGVQKSASIDTWTEKDSEALKRESDDTDK